MIYVRVMRNLKAVLEDADMAYYIPIVCSH